MNIPETGTPDAADHLSGGAQKLFHQMLAQWQRTIGPRSPSKDAALELVEAGLAERVQGLGRGRSGFRLI